MPRTVAGVPKTDCQAPAIAISDTLQQVGDKRVEGKFVVACRGFCAGIGAAILTCFVRAGIAADMPDPAPAWAFPVNPPSKASSAPTANKIEHVAGSSLSFTDRQLNDEFFVADWFPAEHGAMPPAVTTGRKPAVMPCAVCHLPTGNGGPAEAALPGLPESYIIEQINEFRAGRRTVAQPRMQSARAMEAVAKAVTDSDLAAAARYFSRLKFSSHFHVVETDIAPRTRVGEISLNVKIAGSEPLGQRIVEVPDDAKQWEFGNAHTEFTAYVPKGSIRRGATLVLSGGRALPCRSCHGPDLKGMGNAPPLAGRSPSYLARQLYDIQHGTRKGSAVALMIPEVAHMTPADRIAIVAYLASLGG
jgi:cytochrome c553